MLHNGQNVTTVTFNGETVNKVIYNGNIEFVDTANVSTPAEIGLPTTSGEIPESSDNHLTTMLVPQDWDESSTVANLGYYGDYTAVNMTKDATTGTFEFTSNGSTTGSNVPRMHGPWFHTGDPTTASTETHKKSISVWVKPNYDGYTGSVTGGLYASNVRTGGPGRTYNAGSYCYLRKPGNKDYQYALGLSTNSTASKDMYGENEATYYHENSDASIPSIDDWTMLTHVYDSDRVHLFRNDIFVGSSLPYNDPETQSAYKFTDSLERGENYFKRILTIGCNVYYTTGSIANIRLPYTGLIGHVFAWSGKAIDHADVKQLYNDTRPYYDQFRSERPLDLTNASGMYGVTGRTKGLFNRTMLTTHSYRDVQQDGHSQYVYNGSNSAPTGFLGVDLNTTEAVRGYRVILPIGDASFDYETNGRWPKNWTFEGSTDNTNWTVLDTVVDANYDHGSSLYAGNVRGSSIKRMFTNATAYRYYRLNITANGGDPTYTVVGELELFGF